MRAMRILVPTLVLGVLSSLAVPARAAASDGEVLFKQRCGVCHPVDHGSAQGPGLGRVIGITPSQSARNTLAAGVPECYNAAQFLGHLPGQRGARGAIELHPGDLVLIDEASMVATPDLADIITQATASNAKVILAGDTQQLQAVENGGGMSLLATRLGYARLAEPVRFRQFRRDPRHVTASPDAAHGSVPASGLEGPAIRVFQVGQKFRAHVCGNA